VTIAPFWTLSRVADALVALATAPPPRGDSPVERVWTDTRTIQPGDLFVALRGERFDAHDFLAQAVQAGAVAVVVADARRAAGLGVPAFVVSHCTRALGALAAYRRNAWGKPVIAVGGSNGKTSTKELIRAALESRLEVHATHGNLNNQVGVPQTLLATADHADVAVIEVGTNTPGEIALLRDIVRPDVAVVTAIAEEHLEGFGDLAGVLREEAALLDGVGVAVVPAHEASLVAEARQRARAVTTAGLRAGDVRASDALLLQDGTGRLEVGDTIVRVPLRGAHNLRNAMLALAVARTCGVSLDDAARGISALNLGAMPAMRSAVEPLGDALLVNDAYNANPGSARAAIELLEAVAGARPRVIVLGTMRELGAHTEAAHRQIARVALDSGAVVVAGIGAFAAPLRDAGGTGRRVVTATDVDDLWPQLEPLLPPAAAILIKASRGVRLERLVPHLRAWAEDPSPYRTG
jgi:UDP-N-acetylmuramoyl-tripeptide--D-alanyl-D-alanine ligase